MSEKCAVILAGGRGTRLRPYTIALPKPLVPIGDMPILEIILTQLANAGFKRVILTVNHLADIIQAYCKDGSRWGIRIEYSSEDKPLSTMGPLTILRDLPEHFLVINGDVLTDLSFTDFFAYHTRQKSLFTIAGHNRTQVVDYGVLHTAEDGRLSNFEEKPHFSYTVSMGVYAVSRDVLRYIPADTFFGFDHLMHALLKTQETVSVFPYGGYWMDIGRPDDYQQAIEDFDRMKEKLLS
jgi:NDP-sugar pyrophosphorylase family protein